MRTLPCTAMLGQQIANHKGKMATSRGEPSWLGTLDRQVAFHGHASRASRFAAEGHSSSHGLTSVRWSSSDERQHRSLLGRDVHHDMTASYLLIFSQPQGLCLKLLHMKAHLARGLASSSLKMMRSVSKPWTSSFHAARQFM
eukprot:770294-Amphidinium_carterae.1